MNDLERQVLNYVERFIDENNFSPSFREIVRNTNASTTSTVKYVLESLQDQGCISINPKTARSIVIEGRTPNLNTTTTLPYGQFHDIMYRDELNDGEYVVVTDVAEEEYIIGIYDAQEDVFKNKLKTRTFDNVAYFMRIPAA